MLVAASKPLTTGLSARPTSDAVVSSPKPAPRAEAGSRACRRVRGGRRDTDGKAEQRRPGKQEPGTARHAHRRAAPRAPDAPLAPITVRADARRSSRPHR